MLKFIYILILLSLFQYINTKELKGDLVFSQILFRHGDRPPIEPYPNDPWKDVKYWPTDFGHLTNTGISQLYELGIWLRNRYNSILNDKYSKNLIYVVSTDVDRTIMSAQSLLAGLFPPKGDDIWNPNLKWHPIPIHTVPRETDSLLAMKGNCPAYHLAKEKWMKSDEYQNLIKKYEPVFDYMTKHSGKKVKTFHNVQQIYNTLYVETLYNKKLPKWTEHIYNNPEVYAIANFSYAVPTYTRPMARLKAGLLVKEIFTHMEKKINGTLVPNRSLWLYSGHDSTIANLLNTLKLFEYHSPPYRACIMIELRLYLDQPLVSIFYKNTTAEPDPMYIPNCGYQCPLEKMKELYADVLPGNWEEECKVLSYYKAKITEQIKLYKDLKFGLSIFAITIIIFILSLLLYCIFINYRISRNQTGYIEIC